MPFPRSCFLSVLAVVAAACGEPVAPDPAPEIIEALPRALTAGEGAVIAADNRFTFSLLRATAATTRDTLDNLFVSPVSVAMALGMTWNGAAGTTEAAMQEVLELEGLSRDEVNHAYRDVIDLLRALDPRVAFEIANSIWYRDGIPVEPGFVQTNQTYFDAEVRGLEFARPEAADVINAWVDAQTHGKIREIVPKPIPGDVIMYLINAIYFKGDWTQQFDPALTKPGTFHLADGGAVSVPLMEHAEPAGVLYHADQDVQVADLAYGGRAYAMTLVIPRDAAAIDALVDRLTIEQWNGWITGLDSAGMKVRMPKFTLTNTLSLNDVLKSLGMAVAFDCGAADFTRMVALGGVCISNVRHKTFVDVNEEGTEAAAVTSVEMGIVSVGPPSLLVVDRPYLYALRERLSGTILFIGVMRNPATATAG